MASQSVKKHNETVLANLEPGDLVEFPRGVYSHWAVYIGDGNVVHVAVDGNEGKSIEPQYSSSVSGMTYEKAEVKQDKFWDVVEESKALKNNSNDKKYRPFSKTEIVERAKSKIGKMGYNVLIANCEHFATWCRYGRSESKQADMLFWLTGFAGPAVVSLAGILGVGSYGPRKHTQ